MTIKKFQGKTKEEAIEKAKAELGEEAVVMNVKEITPKGLFKSFKQSTFEITAAIEEKESRADTGMALKNMQNMQKTHETINMAADEPISIPAVTAPAASAAIDQNKAEQSEIGRAHV